MPLLPEPRKQPKQDRSTHVVSVILEATEDVLARQGPELLTTTRIAERAGVAVGSLYQYFPNKQAIIGVLVEMAQAERRIAIEEAADHGVATSLVEGVSALAKAAVADHQRRRRLTQALQHEEMRPLVSGVIERENARVRAALARFIAHYGAALGDPDPEKAAVDILVMVRAALGAPDAVVDRTSEELEAAVARIVGGYLWAWRGLGLPTENVNPGR